jgi:hypothetical protein
LARLLAAIGLIPPDSLHVGDALQFALSALKLHWVHLSWRVVPVPSFPQAF